MNEQLIPRAPKHKKQPTAEQLRVQLALAADRIIDLQRLVLWYERDRGYRFTPDDFGGVIHFAPRAPWWRRLLQRITR